MSVVTGTVKSRSNFHFNGLTYAFHATTLATLSGNHRRLDPPPKQEIIEYLRTENQVLREKLRPKHILLNDDQRRRLAVKGKMLEEVGTLFTPDTILRWHRILIAQKWDYSDRKQQPGRPRIRQVIVDLTLPLANGNPAWGYDRWKGKRNRSRTAQTDHVTRS